MSDAVNDQPGQMLELEALADALPTGLLVVNRQGTISLANTVVSALLGIPADQRLDGQMLWQVLPAGLRELVAAMQREVLIYGTEARRDFEFNVSNGKRRLLELHLSPVASRSAQPELFCLAMVEAADRQEVAELKKLDQLKSNFLAMISHELRTPLTSIRGAVHLLADSEVSAADPAKALVGIIQSNSERLIRLVNNLLEMVAVDNDTFVVSRTPAYIKPLVDQAVSRCESAAKAKFLTLGFAGSDCSAEVDPERFVQFVSYLVDNAIKFTPHGGTISIRATCDNAGALNIVVSDTGCGVPAYAREKIFDRFYQVEDPMTRCTGGAGVGLYLAKHIVLRHGGRVWVDSNACGGSDFHAHFPAQSQIPASAPLP
jgi:two-component system phosphate regulon sensor histidine kinase PhoR